MTPRLTVAADVSVWRDKHGKVKKLVYHTVDGSEVTFTRYADFLNWLCGFCSVDASRAVVLRMHDGKRNGKE